MKIKKISPRRRILLIEAFKSQIEVSMFTTLTWFILKLSAEEERSVMQKIIPQSHIQNSNLRRAHSSLGRWS